MPDLIAELGAIVGPHHVLTAPDQLAGYVTDWTRRFRGEALAVVRPATTPEVVAAVGACRVHGAGVVPQGGNTGMVGGATPRGGEVVLSTARLAGIGDVDAVAGQLTADAGATLAAVHAAARASGWRYGVDLGARDSATIGGTIATNAGGIRVLRHGSTRQQVLGVEAVTGTGAVVGDLRGLVKDNTGYHLPSLLCGSEGTLAIVTRARLALVPASEEEALALVGVPSVAAAIGLVSAVRRQVADLSALELFVDAGLELVAAHFGLPRPLPDRHEAYLLVEVAGAAGAAERLASQLGALEVTDAVVAVDAAARARLWRYREGHTEAINHRGVPHKLDVTVPLPRMAAFAEDVQQLVRQRWPGSEIWLFGHAGDGNLHVNVTGVDPDDDTLDAAVFELVALAGGSISAEHGIGQAKRSWLHLNRTAAERSLFATLKRAFDPDGILNPGVLL